LLLYQTAHADESGAKLVKIIFEMSVHYSVLRIVLHTPV
jgi:hypothetical protein